jgi:predicted lipid-binding transport protein (Tim44 family)
MCVFFGGKEVMFSIVLAFIAFVIFYGLFRVFGRTQNMIIKVDGETKDKFIKLFEEIAKTTPTEAQKISSTTPLQNKILKLQERIPNFSTLTFLKKAEEMFDAIFDAFIKAQHETLQSMLSSSLYKSFADMIARRSEKNYIQELLIKHNKTSITTVRLLQNKASLTIEFDVTQMSALMRSDGTPIDNPNKISRDVLHTWIFERAYKYSEWKLTGTSSVAK